MKIYEKSIYSFTAFFKEIHKNQPFSLFYLCLFELCRGQISNVHSSIKSTWTYTFLDHLCFIKALGCINNHITVKSLYFEKGPCSDYPKHFLPFKYA